MDKKNTKKKKKTAREEQNLSENPEWLVDGFLEANQRTRVLRRYQFGDQVADKNSDIYCEYARCM